MIENKVLIKNIEINYKIFGGGRPIDNKVFLILHGWGSSSDKWIKEAEIISQRGFRVIIPDLPGFGASQNLEKPWTVNNYIGWFEEFTKIINVENFYLLGHSFGGALALKIAVKYPQRVQRLFLVAVAVIRKKTNKKKFFAKISKIVKLFYFLPYYYYFRKAVYKFIIKKSDYVYTEGIMKETYLNVVGEDIYHYLSYIKITTVIIWGDKDQSVPVEDAYLINEKIKNSKLVIIPDADHLMHKKIPEILAEKILENLSPA